eukprot:GGOE01062182.1.p1 GENE.GGOE01062182.1~~GGOE01062182.1.p1  ORF type:complete len:692 (-),score=88.69 GGOE01062182.1:206-2281(-)
MLKLNKTLIQKDRGGFQNGPWNGHFESPDGLRRYFTIQLHFHKNGTVDGQGQDQLGKFKLKDASFERTQTPHTFKARLKWDTKQEMEVAGVLDPSTSAINGTFSSNDGDGSVSMQPTFTGINDLAAAKEPPNSPKAAQGPSSNSSATLERPPSVQAQGPKAQTGTTSRRPPSGPSAAQLPLPSEADLESIASLMEMGFDRRLCELAVYNAGTREAQVDWIYSNMSKLAEHRSARSRPNAFNEPVPPQLVQQLVAMGFEAETAAVALRHHNLNVSAAAEYLLTAPSTEPVQEAGGRASDPFGNLLSAPHHTPPAHLVDQLLEIVPAADRQLATAALVQSDNDLELAINWVLERGTTSVPAPQGIDDLFGQPLSDSHHPHASEGEGASLALNRRRAPPAQEEDLFSGPALAGKGPPSSGGFDDFFSAVPSTSKPHPKPAGFDPFGGAPEGTPNQGSASLPRRAAPASPKRAPPAPPGASTKPHNPLAGLPSMAGSHASKTSFNAFAAFSPDFSAPPADPFPPPSSSLFPAAPSGPFSARPTDAFSTPADPFPAETSAAPPPPSFAPSSDLFPATTTDPFPASTPDPFASTPDPFAATPVDPLPASDPFPSSHPDPFPPPAAHAVPCAAPFSGSADPFSVGGLDPSAASLADPFPATPAPPAPQSSGGFFSQRAVQPSSGPKAAAQDSLDDFLL